MSVYELNQNRRTVRKFQQKEISADILYRLIDAARVCPSAANLQPLRYKIVHSAEDRAKLFPLIRWAGYLQDGAPKAGEEPTAYIVIAQDLNCRKADASLDAGAAAMAINLCAEELGIGCCWIGSFHRESLINLYDFPESLAPVLVIALGYSGQPGQCVGVENGNIRYYLKDDGTLCVPKREISDILF